MFGAVLLLSAVQPHIIYCITPVLIIMDTMKLYAVTPGVVITGPLAVL